MSPKPTEQWSFRYRGFVIGAWWGPSATDPELQLYREAGFNVVMVGRYMQLDNYGDAAKGLHELDLARKHRLWAMFDTYTKNDQPWGGRRSTEPYDHPTHHPATLAELQWLYEQVGRHPALLGFMIGDDHGEVTPRAAECTRFLYERPKPHLMPWLCGWIPPENLARHNNPICNPQIYPTLYERQLPAEQLAWRYVSAYAAYSRQCRQHGIIFWPMFNVTFPPKERSDSLVRFPAYLALAYGASGIWYFTYNFEDDSAVQRYGSYRTLNEVRSALTPLYPVVKDINGRIASWGNRVTGRECAQVYCTGFQRENIPSADAPFVRPAASELVQEMSDDLLVGVLTQKGKPPLAMVVNCSVSKGWNDLPQRDVEIRFNSQVNQMEIYEGRRARIVSGNVLRLNLPPGGGQLLELRGKLQVS